TITSVTPSSGSPAGGTSVTVTGTNLIGATAMDFGSSSATFTVNSSTQITATSPAGSGTVDITVTTPGGTSATSSADRFTYTTSGTLPTLRAGGYYNGYAVKPSGAAYAWGNGVDGQLGNGGTSNSTTPVAVSNISTAEVIAGGNESAYVLTSSGIVEAWGDNAQGQLGAGSTTNSDVPVTVSLPSGVTATVIAAGYEDGYAVGNSGTSVYAWGDNTDGSLGNGSTTGSDVPVTVSLSLPSGVTVTAVAGNTHSGYALESNGTIWAWGQNSYGELGDNSTANSTTPVQVQFPSGTTITAIAAGTAYGTFTAYALDSTGNVWAWGHNPDGQLGNGTTTDSHVPVKVSLPSGVTAAAIAGGYESGYALSSGGVIYAWGYNGQGELGNGSTTNSSTPVLVSSLTGISVIASAGETAYAVKSDGTVWAWGSGATGALGDGGTSNAATPVQVSSF
ncbi:MAG: IPT/TIG domain-containing protein, partial [Planctomycetes bacterium]|nr:IPT/TIG domain-containing protein [Planctomycetota bacterium]